MNINSRDKKKLDLISIEMPSPTVIICKDNFTGRVVKSQSVQTILLCKMLQELNEIKNNTISICKKNL